MQHPQLRALTMPPQTHPTRECAEGRHVSTAISEFYKRCLWCGLVAPIGASNTDAEPAQLPSSPETLETCCGSGIRQVAYPRPCITERHDEQSLKERSGVRLANADDCGGTSIPLGTPDPRNDPEQIDARYRYLFSEYIQQRPGLLKWYADNPTQDPRRKWA